MMGQVLLEVANAVADWVGFEGEVASCPCNRPWLRKEVDRQAVARAGSQGSVGPVVVAAVVASEPAAFVAVAIALELVDELQPLQPSAVPNGKPDVLEATPKMNEKKKRSLNDPKWKV